MSTHQLLTLSSSYHQNVTYLLSPWYSWNIAHFAFNNNHSLIR